MWKSDIRKLINQVNYMLNRITSYSLCTEKTATVELLVYFCDWGGLVLVAWCFWSLADECKENVSFSWRLWRVTNNALRRCSVSCKPSKRQYCFRQRLVMFWLCSFLFSCFFMSCRYLNKLHWEKWEVFTSDACLQMYCKIPY